MKRASRHYILIVRRGLDSLMRADLAAVVLVVAATAGCVGSSSGADAPDPLDDARLIDDESGAIQGVVTDDQLNPLAEALVDLDGRAQARAGADGRFTFAMVAAGTHRVTASAFGFRDVGLDIAVAVGQIAPANFILPPVGATGPYHETFQKNGLVACSVGYRAPPVPGRYAALCAVPGYVGLPSPDNSLNYFNEVGMSMEVSGFVFETAWQSTQALGSRMEVILFVHDVPLPNPVGDYGSPPGNAGTSPVRHVFNRTEMDNLTLEDGTSICGDGECYFELGHYANADPGAAADVKLLLYQTFTDYATIFHGFRFDPTFSALPDA